MSRRLNPLPQLVADRLARIQANVDRLIWVRREPLAVHGSSVTDEMLDGGQAASLAYTPVTSGEHFGAPHGGWSHRWFRVEIPAALEGERGRRFLRWKCQGETTAFVDGVPWAGLDPGHPTCPLPDAAAVLYLDTATWFRSASGPPSRRSRSARTACASTAPIELRIRDRHLAAWELKWDLDALGQLSDLLIRDEGASVDASGHGYRPAFDDVSPLLRRLIRGIDACCDAWVAGGVDAMRAAAQALSPSFPPSPGSRRRRSSATRTSTSCGCGRSSRRATRTCIRSPPSSACWMPIRRWSSPTARPRCTGQSRRTHRP